MFHSFIRLSTSTIVILFDQNVPIWELLLSLIKFLRLRIIAKKTLRDFWEVHPDCEQQLKSWYQEAAKAEWINSKQIKTAYPSASFLADNRVVFNIKGNTYRLVVVIQFIHGYIFLRFVGTHAEYDKIDCNTF